VIPFITVGLGGTAWMGYLFLALFSPRPAIAMAPERLTPGANAALEWRFPHGAAGVRSLEIVLEGREEATYTRGTDSITDREVFHRATLVDGAAFRGRSEGSAVLKVPPTAMHSFEARHNKILWHLKVKGSVRFLPGIDLEFPLLVEPASAIGSGRRGR
jgi:hypothetical protein